MKKIIIPQFAKKKDLFAFLVKNKSLLIAQKKMAIKFTDGIPFTHTIFDVEGSILKGADAATDRLLNKNEIEVEVVINTTNLYDSHEDVHFPKMWDKSLKESGSFVQFLKSHKADFEFVIAEGEDLKVFTQTKSWADLGFKFHGNTEALTFKAIVRKNVNAYMFEKYARKQVKNHSAGMGYSKIVMAINDEAYGAEYEAWEKYFPQIVNPEPVEDKGYFFAVKEGKLFEGSAVVRGSNFATPTISVKSKPEEIHSDEDQEEKLEPVDSTLTEQGVYEYLNKNLFTN